MLEIVTLNIEGIKGNSPYLKHLCEENRILCLQEYWLHGYEINIIQGILSGFDFNISCFDDEQIDIELQKRRGKGGVITISGHKSSHIRLNNWKKMKDL
jgi:exonuclease III